VNIPVIDNTDSIKSDSTISLGVYVLNSGKLSYNNASMTYYSILNGFSFTDVFAQKNNRILGDTGEDMIQYGSKIYIAVYQSSLIEVVDAKTMVSIKSIPLVDANNAATKPRTLTSANGKVYIVLYTGSVAQMDTTTYAIEKTVKVGANPDKSVIANNKLYVGNTGGMATVKDSTVSVIDLSTFTELRKVVVNLNPAGSLGADSQGDVYVQSNGNYGSKIGKIQRIEAGTYKVTDIITGYGGFTVDNDMAYIYNFTYDASWQAANKTIKVYDMKNEAMSSTNFTSYAIDKTPYSIGVDPVTKNVYLGVTDYSTLGAAYCFDANGNYKYSFPVGLNPIKFLFLTYK
ncbi:MAG: hypothetical protein RIS29_2859, partial [Bacteroidota bacterium]